MSSTFGVMQKDGTFKQVSKAEFDKYLDAHRIGREDIKNLTNASGRFGDLADVVEVCVDDMWDDEFKEFLGYTTIHKDADGNVIFNMTVEDMYKLAEIAMTFVDCNHTTWVEEWKKNNLDKPLAQMYADALEEDIFANIGSIEFAFLFLTIFVYNGTVTEEKRIKLSDWY